MENVHVFTFMDMLIAPLAIIDTILNRCEFLLQFWSLNVIGHAPYQEFSIHSLAIVASIKMYVGYTPKLITLFLMVDSLFHMEG